MTELYKGYFKLIEEIGEVLQVLGKLGPFPHGNHPDNEGDLHERLIGELSDLNAALVYFVGENKFEIDQARFKIKLAKFELWSLTGIQGEPR